MNCSEIIGFLPAYQENELDKEIYEIVHSHIQSCTTCRNELKLLAASWSALDSLETINPSPNFRDRLWHRIENEEKSGVLKWLSPIFSIRWPVLASGVALAWLVGVVGGITTFQTQRAYNPSVTERSITLFTEPYPSNSIEAMFLESTNHKESQ